MNEIVRGKPDKHEARGAREVQRETDGYHWYSERTRAVCMLETERVEERRRKENADEENWMELPEEDNYRYSPGKMRAP